MEFPEIPGYKIIREVGVGGMATVYLAVQESLHREVALKVMTPGLAVDKTSCHRFLKEGRIAAQLSHPNLLTVFDIGVHDELYYMASEYLPGGTARDRMEAGLSESDAVRIINDIAHGLQYAHSKGFVHRDVKPGNLLFRAGGECVLGDFGIAKSVDSNTNATKIGTSIGTPHYMSPEQAKGEKVDHRTDLYSLGVVFFEILTGEPPFDADDPFSVALMQINDPVPKLPDRLSAYQPLIEKLMAKQREQRYDYAESFIEDLETASGQVDSSRRKTKRKADPVPAADVDTAPSRAVQRIKRAGLPGGWVRVLSAVLAVAAVLIAIWWFQDVDWPLGTADAPALEAEPADPTADVDQLVEQARELIAAGAFFPPAEPNAYQRLQQALRLEPDSRTIRDVGRQLVNAVEARAESLWQEGKVEPAQGLIAEGLRRFPGDAGLRYLLARIEQSQDRSTQEAAPSGTIDETDADRLLARAQRFMDAGELLGATRLYQQVLELEPGNAEAERRLITIAESWATAAERSIQQQRLEFAEGMIEKGLQARPGYPRLLALKERLDALKQSEQSP